MSTPEPARDREQSRVQRVLAGLAREHATPLRLGVAVGLGAFIGSTPFFGFHTPSAVLLSRVLRLNLFGIILGTQVSLPFFAPFLIYACIQVGHHLRTGVWPAIALADIDVERAGTLFGDWLLGSALVGGGLALLLGATTAGLTGIIRARNHGPGRGGEPPGP